MEADFRNITSGHKVPCGGYCDQPYVVVNGDGSWTCVLTTGAGREGRPGQHVVSCVSSDRGRTWSEIYEIEPPSGPEASWAVPLRVPRTGRIYAFYTYNKENLRQVKTVDGGMLSRVDSLGVYAYRYSDDMGRTWSSGRWEIPMRKFECDRGNVYGGRVMFFWGVGKPFIHRGAAYVCASKVGGFGEGFFARNEGVLFRSPNLPEEDDPAKHEWETLPEGDRGLAAPPGGGPVAGEFNATPMNDGSLYGTFRTIDGWSCHAYSRDDGRTWETDWMRYEPGGRKVKNPRSANFVRRFSNGKYLYWFCFNGGEPLRRRLRENLMGYAHRNPVWLSGGVEKDGRIHWSQPEIALYDDKIGSRISYPDFIEQDGRYFVTETQKTAARVHELDAEMLEAMWRQAEGLDRKAAEKGIVMEWEGAGEAPVAGLPPLWESAAAAAGGENNGVKGHSAPARGGISLELVFRFEHMCPWQVLFDSREGDGRGMLLQLTDRSSVKLSFCGLVHDEPGSAGGTLSESSWECDRGLIMKGQTHHAVFIIDGGPKTVSVLVDGVLCDGADERQFGWGRFHPNIRDINGADTAKIAPSMRGEVKYARLYGRRLLTSEAVANYRAFRADMNRE